jgi:hypothetical protein
MLKKPAACFVKMKLHGMIVPLSFIAVSAPTTVPAGAFAATFKLLIVIVMNLSISERDAPLNHPGIARGDRRSGISIDAFAALYTFFRNLSIDEIYARTLAIQSGSVECSPWMRSAPDEPRSRLARRPLFI